MRNGGAWSIVPGSAENAPQVTMMNMYATIKNIVEQAVKAAQGLTGKNKWRAAALAVLAAMASLALYGCPEYGVNEARLLHELYHSLTDLPCLLRDK